MLMSHLKIKETGSEGNKNKGNTFANWNCIYFIIEKVANPFVLGQQERKYKFQIDFHAS